MYLVVLGRQPKISIAELESIYEGRNIDLILPNLAIVETDSFSIDRLGGTKKAGHIICDIKYTSNKLASNTIHDILSKEISGVEGKVTLGISGYGNIGLRFLQKTGLRLKSANKKSGGPSLRLIPSQELEISTATSHHNKLGRKPNAFEFFIVVSKNRLLIAKSVGSQNISAYAARDQKRPARDAFVGMLPPKLAQVILNLASQGKPNQTVLDPFCGTGTLLQEACLDNLNSYGTDFSQKMIDYSKTNLDWLAQKSGKKFNYKLAVGDATKFSWNAPIDCIACETYLGQPFSAPPSTKKLFEVESTCKQIISGFLKNIYPQIKTGTRLCLAIPAWRRPDGSFHRLKMLDDIDKIGYNLAEFNHVQQTDFLYYRDNQIVGRELLVLIRR